MEDETVTNGQPAKKLKTTATDMTGAPVSEPIVRINTRQYGVTEVDLEAFLDGCEIKQTFISKLGCFAFVEFTDEENAKKAMEKNGEKLNKVKTKIFRIENARTTWSKLEALDASENTFAEEPESADSHLVVIKFLQYLTTAEDIAAIFDDALHVHMVHDSYKHKGSLAIVEFAEEEQQTAALAKHKTRDDSIGRVLNITKIEQEALVRVLDALNVVADPGYIYIKITGIAFDATDEEVEELFEGINAEERYMLKSLEDETVGIMFAAFSSKLQAAELILKHRTWVCGRPVSMQKGHPDELKALTAGSIVFGRKVGHQNKGGRGHGRFHVKRKFGNWGGRGRGRGRRQQRQTPSRESLDAEMDNYKKSAGGAEGSTS